MTEGDQLRAEERSLRAALARVRARLRELTPSPARPLTLFDFIPPTWGEPSEFCVGRVIVAYSPPDPSSPTVHHFRVGDQITVALDVRGVALPPDPLAFVASVIRGR